MMCATPPTVSPDRTMPDADPRPIPPDAPDRDDCCGDGCARCVNDLHDEALERHRAALADWEARRAAGSAGRDG